MRERSSNHATRFFLRCDWSHRYRKFFPHPRPAAPRRMISQQPPSVAKRDLEVEAFEHLMLDAVRAPTRPTCRCTRDPLGDLDLLGLGQCAGRSAERSVESAGGTALE